MKITRTNYEEYFILFMDNELNGDERCEVELFVQENPDLKPELDLLLQSKMVPDTSVVFDIKSQILKNSTVKELSVSNNLEWLLLYIDNELTADQKKKVEKLLAIHPALRTELTLLQKLKLQPDPDIILKNRESLYRSEDKVRVLKIHWRKVAVAAVFLMTLGTTVFLVVNKKKNISEELVINERPAVESGNTTLPGSHKTGEVIPELNPVVKNRTSDIKNRIEEISVNRKYRQGTRKPETSIPEKHEANFIAELNNNVKETNQLPSSIKNPNVHPELKENGNNPVTSAKLHDINNITSINDKKSTTPVTQGIDQSLTNIVTVASTEPTEMMDTDPSGRKNKLRGFFRKVTRNFEKRTNIKATGDDDRLLLAGFSVKL